MAAAEQIPSAQPGSLPFNQQRADAFADKLVGIMNSGALSLMISVGHRTHLFDAMSGLAPSTSAELARQSGLNERYVREWLGAMTVGGIVSHDPAKGTYWLPAEHAGFLTRAASPNNFAVAMQFLPGLARVEDDIVECFRNGGGVPYERYDRFHEVMAEESSQSVLSALESDILPLVAGLPARLEAGISMADFGCGRGRAINRLAARYPNSRFTGYDLSEEAIDFAREEAKRLGNRNVEFVAKDLGTFDRDAPIAQYDFATTFDAVHDQPAPLALVKGIRRALKDDGVYLAQEIKGSGHHHADCDNPHSPFLYTISCMHCMTVSLAQGGEGLGAMWGREKAHALFRDAGFASIIRSELEHDVMNDYYVCRP